MLPFAGSASCRLRRQPSGHVDSPAFARLARFPPVNESESSAKAIDIIANAPQAIDIVASRHGQTLRYHGLPFARVRRVMEQDRIWFGIEGSRRRMLDDFHRPDWAKLFQDFTPFANYSSA